MTVGEFFDNFWQALPGTDIIYHLTKRPDGISPHEYAGFACSAEECRAVPAAAITRCRKDIATKAALWIADWVGISTGADIIKVIVGVLIAVFLGETVVGLAVGAILAVLGVIDITLTQRKANQIASAATAAQGIYCVCGWEGPPPP